MGTFTRLKIRSQLRMEFAQNNPHQKQTIIINRLALVLSIVLDNHIA